jgi:O-antigen ligase
MGIEARSIIRRGLYWIAAGACLVIVGLTVSRGPLIGAGMALVVSFRGMLKRGFLPLLVVVVIAGIALETGLIDPIVSSYKTRGLEETGRLLLWPYVVERIFAAPFVGVGATDISTYIPEIGTSITTPHNSFLYFALTSGMIPFLLWVGFWMRSGWKSMFGQMQGGERSFQLPILVYLFVNSMLGDIDSDPWVLLGLSVAAGSAVVYAKKHRVWVRGIMGQRSKTQYQESLRTTAQLGDKPRSALFGFRIK